MKKTLYRLLAIATIFSLTVGVQGCTDLKEEPVGLLAPEAFFKTAKDVETSVMGAYGFIASESYYGRKLVLTLQLRSDMCDIGDRNTPGRRQQVNDFNMDSNNGMVTAFWPRSYQIISAANAAINGGALVGEEDPEVAALVGEARFIRGFIYYHLVRLFGDVPYIDFFINDPSAIKEIAKTPASEVYAGIIADFEYAKANLPDGYGGPRTRPSKATAAAYLASVHLTQGNWQGAYDESKWVIDNKDRFDIDLMDDFAELYDGFNNDGLKEHLFAVDFLGNVTGSSNAQTDWMGPITGIRNFRREGPGTGGAGWSVSVPSLDVYLTWDERDYRRKVSLIDSGYVTHKEGFVGYEDFAPNHSSPRPHQGKYYRVCGNNRGDCGQSDNNYSAMRYAEVLLIAAEALNELGGSESEILSYINEIRGRARNWAGTPQTFPEDVAAGLSKAELTDLILEERRLELAFEYKRWYDIKRRNLGDEVFKGANSLEPHSNFDESRDYFLPLPQDELDRNPNLMPQNSGY